MALVRVYLTCDADQDYSTGIAPQRDSPSWAGLGLLPEAALEFSRRGLRLTVFVRADHQIRDLIGSALAIYRRVEMLLAGAEVELGWHPHLYAREGERYVPIRDPVQATALIDDVNNEISSLAPAPSSVRLGEAWHSNLTMRRLAALGYRIDSTAVPGRKRNDDVLEFDWEPTPNRPYRPSAADYRIEGHIDPLPILEVPMTTCRIQTDYDVTPVRRYLNLVFHEQLFAAAVDDFLATIGDAVEATLVVVFHSGELLPLPSNGLYAYGMASLRRNLDHLLAALDEAGHVATFHNIRDAAS